MHRERLALAVRAEAQYQQIEHRGRLPLSFERHRQHACRFVDHDEGVVFEDDPQIAGSRGRSAPRASGAIHPDANAIASREPDRSRVGSRFNCVEEYFPSIERDGSATSGAEALALSEKLIKPHALLGGRDDPFHLLEFSRRCSSSDASWRRSFWPSRFHTCSRQFTVFPRRSALGDRRSGIPTRTRAAPGSGRISTRTDARGAVSPTAASWTKTSSSRTGNTGIP